MKNIRYYLFWGIDLLTGSKKRKHYNEIKKTYHQKDDYQQIVEKRISDILSYAREKTLFYKKIKSNNIKNFPVINKQIVNADYDSFFSEEFVNQKKKAPYDDHKWLYGSNL